MVEKSCGITFITQPEFQRQPLLGQETKLASILSKPTSHPVHAGISCKWVILKHIEQEQQASKLEQNSIKLPYLDLWFWLCNQKPARPMWTSTPLLSGVCSAAQFSCKHSGLLGSAHQEMDNSGGAAMNRVPTINQTLTEQSVGEAAQHAGVCVWVVSVDGHQVLKR